MFGRCRAMKESEDFGRMNRHASIWLKPKVCCFARVWSKGIAYIGSESQEGGKFDVFADRVERDWMS